MSPKQNHLKNYITIKSSNQYLSLFRLFKETHLSFGERCAKELCTEITTSFWRKLLRLERTFHEKSFVSGFGADAQLITLTQKARQRRAFYIIINSRNCRSEPPLQGAFPKSPLKIRKNFHTENTALFWQKFFWGFPKQKAKHDISHSAFWNSSYTPFIYLKFSESTVTSYFSESDVTSF